MMIATLRAGLWCGVLLYVLLIIQIHILGVWPLVGGQPHLIALVAPLFLILDRPTLGLAWCAIGGLTIDALSSVPLGTTTLPLLLSYGAAAHLTRRVIDLGTWWMVAILCLSFVLAAELPLGLIQHGWRQFGSDLTAAVLLAVPLGILAVSWGRDVRQGLKLRA